MYLFAYTSGTAPQHFFLHAAPGALARSETAVVMRIRAPLTTSIRMKAIVGRKLRMSRMYDDEGRAISVTLLQVGPCTVERIKTVESDGYRAAQLAFETKRVKTRESGKGVTNVTKEPRVLREVRLSEDAELEQGAEVNADVFEQGDTVRVVSTSKGRGFTGVVKRWGFAGGPKSHGHRHVLRQVGSIGGGFPQHVLKGMKMPGQYGAKRNTVRGLKVMHVDAKNNVLAVKGSVPGAPGTLVMVEAI